MAVPKKSNGLLPGFHRRAVACAVQPFGQPAYDHHTPLRHCQRKIPAGGKPILCGAAGAHHAHIPPPVQAGRVSGAVQHQRQVGQVPQAVRVYALVGRQHVDARQQAVGRARSLMNQRASCPAAVPARGASGRRAGPRSRHAGRRTAPPGRGRASAVPAHIGSPEPTASASQSQASVLSMGNSLAPSARELSPAGD